MKTEKITELEKELMREFNVFARGFITADEARKLYMDTCENLLREIAAEHHYAYEEQKRFMIVSLFSGAPASGFVFDSYRDARLYMEENDYSSDCFTIEEYMKY